ncbi:hypothetical protein SAMN05192529_1319 [Arachidicoccus rhizosphaerae]|uniref:Uncharacterized protein n=2 Tax=Arachidicoccus rhizosphaerae TaxID=551991 RepID=A0A1H4CEQ6_9BACT|nr:hypothetical protein SAMN05192529_1319 [Arachidicoccus rhizosphaerae]
MNITHIEINTGRVKDLDKWRRYNYMNCKPILRKYLPMFINKWQKGDYITIKELNKVDRELNDFLYTNKIKVSVSRENIIKFIKEEYGACNIKLGGKTGERRGFYFGNNPEESGATKTYTLKIKGLTATQILEVKELINNFKVANLAS